MITTRSRNIAASIANSRVNELARVVSTDQAAHTEPQVLQEELRREGARPRLRRGTVHDHRRERRLHHGLPGTERGRRQQDGRRTAREPEAQRSDGGGGQGGEQDRQRAAPDDGPPGERQHDKSGHGEDGEHDARRHGAESPHLRHIDVEEGDRKAEPERAECVAHMDPAHRCAHRPGHFHLPWS
jgi:hypothetical protein